MTETSGVEITFRCPNCGCEMFRSSDVGEKVMTRHCKGANYGPYMRKLCKFTFPSTDDWKYFIRIRSTVERFENQEELDKALQEEREKNA